MCPKGGAPNSAKVGRKVGGPKFRARRSPKITRCFQERVKGQMETPSSWKIVKGGEDRIDEDLATIRKTTETATCKVAHHTKAEREVIIQSTPENVR